MNFPPCALRYGAVTASACAAAALLLPTAACSGAPDSGESGYLRRDSARVVIVDNRWPRTDSRFVLDSLSFDGAREGFEQVGLVSRDPSGRLVLGDRAAGRIVMLDSLDRPRLVVGGAGAGPAEFRALRAIEHDGSGRLIAFDPGNSRVTWFSRSGGIEREQAVVGAMAIGAFDDGALLLRRIDPEQALTTAGVHRPPHVLSILSADGLTESPVVSITGDEAVYERHPRMGLVYGPVPFGRSTLTALGTDRIVVAENVAFELRVYGIDGKLSRMVRRQAADVPVTRDRVEQYLATLPGSDTEEGRRRHREGVSRMQLPHTLPFVDVLRLSRAGTAWVRSYPVPGSRFARWSVFSSTGELVVEGELPAGFRATSATDSTLLGVMEGDEGDLFPAEARIEPGLGLE